MTADDVERFNAKIDTTPGQGPEGTCHNWTAALDGCGGRVMTMSRYDAWKTSAPGPDSARCVVCGDLAYNRKDREDRAHGDSADGDGVVCSALCAFRDALAHWSADRPDEAARRVQALRAAVDDGVEFPDPLCFTLAVTQIEQRTIVGSIWHQDEMVRWGRGALRQVGPRIEDMDGHGAPVDWNQIIDVRLAPDA